MNIDLVKARDERERGAAATAWTVLLFADRHGISPYVASEIFEQAGGDREKAELLAAERRLMAQPGSR